MFLDRKTCLALAVLIAIAHHGKQGRKMTSQALVKRYQLSERALEGILQSLVKAGLIRSYRGKHGGYECVSPQAISVATLFENTSAKHYLRREFVLFEPVFQAIILPVEQKMLSLFESITIADLVKQVEKTGIDSLEPLLDYTI